MKYIAIPRIRQQLFYKWGLDVYKRQDENRWSVAASLAVADSPGATYNPLFIYGGPGLGKTHLLNAIGNKVLHDNPQARIKYIKMCIRDRRLINLLVFSQGEKRSVSCFLNSCF